MKRIVILISGRGSNMMALVEACAGEGWDACIAGVIASRADAAGLGWAEARGIAVATVPATDFRSRDAFDAELMRVVDGFAADLVLLAGFMRILGPDFVRRYEGRLLNIHPSLLPAFTGLHTHRRALAVGCKLAGASVHFVSAELDGGPIVVQAAVPVRPGDTESTLAARVLEREHVIYPLAVGWWLAGALRVEHGIVSHVAGADQFVL